jgi:serine/threonine protein kinase
MEYMDGGHLGERGGDMNIQQALWTSIAIVNGLHHAHRRGVAHLDLKPENILFRTVQDAWDVPKIADWGLSKHLLEHPESVDGISPHYAAPEQFDEAYGVTDDITDIYQLGAVYYYLFTGKPPFDGEPTEAMYDILHTQPVPPSELTDVPNRLDEILLKALAKEKSDRYDSVVLFRNDLRNLLDQY